MEIRLSKTTLILLVFFFSIIVSLLFWYNKYTQAFPSVIPKTSTGSNSPSASGKLSFFPNMLTAISGGNSSINIELNTDSVSPVIVQLEIGYDPQVLTNIEIVPGSFFLDPIVLVKTINERTGRISFVLQDSQDKQNTSEKNGTVATLFFKTKSPVSQNETVLSFLPKTAIRIKGDMNVLQSTDTAKIILQTSPSAILR